MRPLRSQAVNETVENMTVNTASVLFFIMNPLCSIRRVGSGYRYVTKTWLCRISAP